MRGEKLGGVEAREGGGGEAEGRVEGAGAEREAGGVEGKVGGLLPAPEEDRDALSSRERRASDLDSMTRGI